MLALEAELPFTFYNVSQSPPSDACASQVLTSQDLPVEVKTNWKAVAADAGLEAFLKGFPADT